VIELSRYVFETLREDGEFVLERGQGDRDLSAILVVAPVSEHPVPEILERLEHEYALRDELDSDWAARPLTLVRREGRPIIILEDPGGEPLDRLVGQPMELSRFLRFAIRLAAALGKLHERGLIHKEIKPANILVNSATGAVWLTGFGIASRIPRVAGENRRFNCGCMSRSDSIYGYFIGGFGVPGGRIENLFLSNSALHGTRAFPINSIGLAPRVFSLSPDNRPMSTY
jgi:serine/threonine protein kinase